MSAGLRRHGLPLLVLMIAVGIALWPLPRLLVSGEGALGHRLGDLADHYWGTWWFGYQILSGQLPARTDLVQYPGPITLWYVDPVGGLLGLLFRPLGFPRVWEAVLAFQVLFGAVAAYSLGVRFSGSRSAAVVAGLFVGACPYVLGLAHSGLSEYIGLGFPVLFTGALIVAMGLDPMERPVPRRAAVVAGLLLAACALQAFYYAAFGALLTAVAVLGPGWRARFRTALTIAGVFAVSAAPLFLAAWATLHAPDAAVTSENAPGWAYRALPATDLLTFFKPGDYYFPDTREENPGILHVNYLGWVALGVAAWGMRQAAPRRLLPMALAFFVLCLGPRLCWNGGLVNWGGGTFPLPLALLYAPGSPFRFVHHPYRMVALLLPLLGVGVALGAARLPKAARAAVAALILAEALGASPAPWPLAEAPTEVPAIYDQIPEGPVLDWPPDATTWNRSYELWQTAHGQPIAYGVNTFLPEALRSDPLVATLLRALHNPERRARNRDVAHSGKLFLPAKAGPTRLGELGYRSLVLHRAAMSAAEWSEAERALVAALGPAKGKSEEGDAVWEIGVSAGVGP